jgi:hypothetical protein
MLRRQKRFMAIESTNPIGSYGWTLGDVVDFERAIATAFDTPAPEPALREEGKRLAELFPGLSLDDIPRPQLFRRWLELRREQDKSLVGREIDSVFRFLGISSWLFGGLAGFLGAAGYLEYNGSKPINVVWFLIWIVGCPWITTAVGIVVATVLRDDAGPKMLGSPLGSLLSRISPRNHRLWNSWSEELHRHGSRLAPIATWPLVGLTQRFACGFAIGALIALLTHVIGVDLAFGWESTLNVGAKAMHVAARWIATPWLGIFPNGAPSFEHVRDSRYTHLLGIKESAIPATRSWWPFLVGCLAVYSVVPRLLIIQLSEWRRRTSLKQLGFTRGIDGALCRGLLGPFFEVDRQTPGGTLGSKLDESPQRVTARATWMVLVAEGLDAHDESVHRAVLKNVMGCISLATPVEIDYPTGNHDLLETVRRSADGLLIVVPVSTDPLEAMRVTLDAFAEASEGRDRFVALIGPEERIDLWQRWARKAPSIDFGIISIPAP